MTTALVSGLDGSIETNVPARRIGSRIEVSVQGATPTRRRQPWSVLLPAIENVASMAGGTAQLDALGTRLVPAEDVRRLVIHL